MPTDVSLTVIDDTDYFLEAKALKKGSSYGIKRVGDNLYVNSSTWYVTITNTLSSTTSTFSSLEDYTSATVYQDVDSLVSDNQLNFSELDTYFDSVEFNSGTTTSVDLDLERKSFGIELIGVGLTEGEISVELVKYSNAYQTIMNYSTDSVFQIISNPNTYQTVISYNDGVSETPLFNQDIDYHENTIKRFEINPVTNSDEKSFSINVIELDFIRGETIVIGGE